MGKKLAQNVNHYGVTYLAGETPPKDVADQLTNPKVWGGDQDDDAAEDKGYSGMSPEDLKAEVDKRNEGREPDAAIEVKGTGANGNVKKGDLIKSLEADDAAQSE